MSQTEKPVNNKIRKNAFVTPLIAGGLAGTIVDAVLFPLDTLKTRLQSQQGFLKSGGFNGLYKGISPVLVGSAPTAALFFLTYETMKTQMQHNVSEQYHTVVHMCAASLAEVVACVIRVPVEVIKQRRQASLLDTGKFGIRLLYRGYWSTVLRDMPFSLVQFPLWEYFKKAYSSYNQNDICPSESAICGAVAGGISAAVTTPLDVIKTRIMLASKTQSSSKLTIDHTFHAVYQHHGLRGLFAGVGPRVMWITLGGFIFFGVYEEGKVLVKKLFSTTRITL